MVYDIQEPTWRFKNDVMSTPGQGRKAEAKPRGYMGGR